jgi:outer membrane protein assembly factor BamB
MSSVAPKGICRVLFACAVCVVLVPGCRHNERKISQSWTSAFKRLGSLSSPRLADLNKDGVLDVVVGAGTIEFHSSDSSILALDGTDGSVLWTCTARDQIFGSAVFRDVTGDEIADIFIGGRSAELRAIDGKSGDILWEYFPHKVDVSKSDSGAYNFFSPQFIPDQDHDGVDDLIIAAGGYVKALPHDPARPAGKILVISSATGACLASATMPDGKEIYMSVVVADFKGDGQLSIIFGTGGETLGGSLYKASLQDILNGDLSNASLLESGYEKGFVAPPVLADITGDKVPDIIANSVNGRMIAIDGATEKNLWRVSVDGTEAYCSIAVGYYTEDKIPDFFTNYGVGIWPDLNRSIQFMVDGGTGQIVFKDSLGTFQESTPVTVDYNGDGVDDAIFSVNDHQRSTGYSNRLMAIDFHRDTLYAVTPRTNGANVASTPWVGDMDDDGLLDIVYCHEVNPFDLLSVTHKQGLKITRIMTEIPITKRVLWGAYMGSGYDGLFIQAK